MTTTDFDAELDPWVPVRLADDERVLFGFALSHAGTGGLAWTRSSPVRRIDLLTGHAVTASARRYRLGRRIGLLALPDLEARVAFALLLGPELDLELDELVGPGVCRAEAADWLRACKMARHLDQRPPPPNGAAVAAFIRRHGAAYLGLRGRGDVS